MNISERQAQLGDQLSESLRTNFITKRLSTALDVAIMFEISPTLRDDDLTETKNFLVALLNAFDTKRADGVRSVLLVACACVFGYYSILAPLHNSVCLFCKQESADFQP